MPYRRGLGLAPFLFLFLFLFACTSHGSGDTTGSKSSKEAWTPPADPDRVTNPAAPPEDVAAVVTGNTSFAIALQQQLGATGGNAVVSPYGVSLNLAELVNDVPAGVSPPPGITLPTDRLDVAFDALDLDLGAISGKTEEGRGLQFQEISAAWGALSGSPALAKYYNAQVLQGPTAGEALQAWQAAVTPGPILPIPLIGACDGFLATLVHFDAAWDAGFDPAATHPAPFTRADGTTASASMMNQQLETVVQADGPVRAIEIPYDGRRLAILVVVPDDLGSFEKSLTPDVFSRIVAGMTGAAVRLSLPKFSVSYSWDVLATLGAMGWRPDPLHWSIVQSADIQVSETGTVATATTVSEHTPSVAVTPVSFVVDKPFDFFIRDTKTGSILFSGRVVDPTAP